MAIATRKRTKNNRNVTHRTIRKIRQPEQGKQSALAGIYLARPTRNPAEVERGRKLAEEVRKELDVLNSESLDQVMSRLRGRAWSS